MILATQNGTQRELIPAGNYVARCYEVIHIGTVTEVINGEAKQLNKVRIGWEFPEEQRVFKEENGSQPLVHSEEFTLSTSEKANLRKMLESWRGKVFTADEAKGFDVSALIGKACMVNIIHGTSKAGKEYAKIGSVSGVPKGMNVPAQINDSNVIEYDNFDQAKFNKLPDFLKNKMMLSQEYLAMTRPVSNGHADGKPAPKRNDLGEVASLPSLTDDLPF